MAFKFYTIMRRETEDFIRGDGETESVAKADRYYTKLLALRRAGPNTCVCGPYSTRDFPR